MSLTEKKGGVMNMKGVMGVFFCFAALLVCSCGGSSSSTPADTTYTVTASVETPVSASVSSPIKSMGMALKDDIAVGVVVQAHDLAGNEIGEPCTTAADGTCSIELTAEELEAGVVFDSENMHSLQDFDATEIAAAGTTPLTAPINTEEDVVYALVAHNCDGAVGSCPDTIDVNCLHDAVAVLPGDDEPGTDTVDGYIEALVDAQRSALINNPTAATDGLVAALDGDTTAYVADVGAESVSDVPVVDAVSNSQVGADSVNTAYCTRPSAGATSPWEDARTSSSTTDTRTFAMAMAGMFEFFPPSELQQGLYAPADFQAFMANGPQLTDFFTTVGGSGNDLARNAFVQGFKNGMFADPANAGVAIGFIGATFPPPVGGVIPWTANAFDPSTAIMAGRNGFVEMTNTSGFNPASFTPNGVYGAFNGALSNVDRRNTFASGGCSDFVGAFMGNPTGFVPADEYGRILAPPGAGCTTNADCLPCDNCVSSVCVAGSSKMGSSCSTDSDCDSVTICVGPPNSAFAAVASKNCMCASGVPSGMGVFVAGGGAPQPYNPAGGGGYQPPAAGAQGGPCAPSPAPACGPGFTCTSTSGSGGVCAPTGTYKFPPGFACTSSDQCMTGDTCTSSICTPGAGQGGSKANGLACSFPNECQSFNCMGGICSAFGGGGGGTLKPDGVACTSNAECGSNFCNATTMLCGQASGGGAEAPCTNDSNCLAPLHCMMGVLRCGT